MIVELPDVDWAIGDRAEMQVETGREHCDCCGQVRREAHPMWAVGTVDVLAWSQSADGWGLEWVGVRFDGDKGFEYKDEYGRGWLQWSSLHPTHDRLRKPLEVS